MSTRSPRSSTEGRLLAAAVLAAALCLAPGVGRAEERTPDEIRERARSVLDNGYQKDLPGAEEGPGGSGSRRSGRNAPPGDGGSFSDVMAPAANAFSYLSFVILIVMAAVALVLLVVWIARNLPSVRSKEIPAPGQDGPAPERPERELGLSIRDAERLASEGRWSEAVHALLLAAVGRLCTRFSVPQAKSRTSRELYRLLPLQGEVREAFAGLVRTVEVSLFGGAELGPEDYQSSLERFRRIEGSH
ncbi:MAG TPA: DUF4129 domain-containing protein [Thermoanaerobaculia bacterium]|nr:DUF4129 domain-containing protein [Thermoanaerobaculia bacterium]